MNLSLALRSATFALIVASAASTTQAQDDDDFRPLFNGKDLEGWVTPDDPDLFRVEDGEIVGETQGDLEKNEFLVTAEPHRNFVLKAKVKIRNGNSGIQFRSARADDGAVSGPQVDVADGYWGVLYDERGSRGIIERYDPDKAAELAKEGDWNEFVITVKGDHLTVVLNGTEIIDREDPEFPDDGVIALQVHVGDPMEVRFKDVEIKDLD